MSNLPPHTSNEQIATHTLSLSLSLSRKYDLLKHKQKVYLANKVYITTSSDVCQEQTQNQEQFVLRSNQKCGVLVFKHNVNSDSNTMSTWIGAQGCHLTRIQAQCVLRLDQQGIQIKASNCD
jgi:hypothetical protein